MKRTQRDRLGRVARDLLDTGQFAPAADLLNLLTELDPEDLSARRREVDALLVLHRFEAALDRALALRAMQSLPSERDIMALSDALMFLGRRKEAAEVVATHAARLAAHLLATGGPRGPLVIVAALPKSGSTSLTQGLAQALALPETEFLNLRGEHSFACRDPVLRAYWPLAGFGHCVHSHIEAQPKAIEALVGRGKAKVFLHIRDPREALLSTIDMVRRIHAPMVLRKCPDFLTRERAAQIDWLVDHYLADQVAWIEDWRALLAARPDLVAGVSTHYDMVAEGHDALARRLARAAGLSVMTEAATAPRRFETGLSGHWAEAFSPGQAARAEAVMGPDLLGWLEMRRRQAGP